MTLPVAVELTDRAALRDRVLGQRQRPAGLEMRGLDDYLRLAEVLAKSEIVPTAYRGKPADIVVAMGMGAELGLSPFNALMSIYVVQGRPSLYVEAAIAIVRASGELEALEVEGTDERATCRTARRGQGEVTLTFTMEDAKKLGLTRNATWASQPGWMLQCRAIGRALHRLFPDLLRGVGIVDPAGRPVEQGDGAPSPQGEPAPPPIAGGSLAALTQRLAERPAPVPTPEPEPDPEPEPAAADEGPSETQIALKRSWIQARRDNLKMTPAVWARFLEQHAGVTDLGQASLDGLDQLELALGKK